jgi:hypothetical protein
MRVFHEGKLSLSIEADYEFVERAVSSALGIDTAIDEAFGGGVDVSTIIPKANIYSLNLVFGFDI